MRKVERAELQRQPMTAFEVSEEKIDELIEIDREVLKEPGREVERTTWRNAMSVRSVRLGSPSAPCRRADALLPLALYHSQEHERRRDLYDRGQAGEFVIEDVPKYKDMPECIKSTMKMVINVLTGA